jgi:hypothetical protein
MEDKIITEQESFRLINQMINTAKREQKDDGKGWIIWGWMIFAASILTFFNVQYGWFNTFFFWNGFGFIAITLGLYETFRVFVLKKKERVRTYTRDIHQKLNTGFFISLSLIIISMNKGVHPTTGFSLLLGLYGFWILIYGTLLNFKPSIVGAYITWALAFAGLFVKNFEITMLIHAAAVLCGYIIPGHLANREFNKQTIE